ncbi:acyltransferase [Rhodocytophaga rosea]|uniref:Acyltransferase n=1 Tax=Rhodocytophaga rosea TaxID=2704465 RepID=A0A6C0GRJ8_9BACT|nr:acyltransferase [Rhodocytophaga rosea]QHT70557.1 acyltransferase [Rhodocytophaga rosea]
MNRMSDIAYPMLDVKPQTNKIYFKGLNGLRAIAALAVIISHINMTLGQFDLPVLPTLDLAGFGVTIFFSLSGFLISYLLLAEKSVSGSINIHKFYYRRILRIWPLYYFYLMMTVIIAYVATQTAVNTNVFYYLFFVPNVPFVFGGSLQYLAHYWSLGVEEQFYSFWPWVIRYAKNVLLFLIIFIGVFVLLKIAANRIWGGNSLPYTFLYVTRFDCMAIGGIGAWILYDQKNSLHKLIVNHLSEVFAWIILFLVSINRFHILSIIDHEIIAVVTVIVILNQCSNKKPLINLENSFFDFAGKISFGMYVYHPIVIFLLTLLSWKALPELFVLRIGLVYASVIMFTITVSYLSYRYLEKPALVLKEKFTVIKSVNSKYL